MFDQDTICAVSTPPGAGGIGIIRISGNEAVSIASIIVRLGSGQELSNVSSHSIRFGTIVDAASGEIIDEALVSVMRAPSTYTREDVVEINCHGGPLPLWRTIGLLIKSGARQAEPGEFTRRAFLNGRIDLSQAEAVMDIISARTDLAHRAANAQLMGGLSEEIVAIRERLLSLTAAVEAGVDFPEEDIETGTGHKLADEVTILIDGIDRLLDGYNYGKILRDGFATAIVGKPNVGKSSLLNALLQHDRAIVTDIPGTTRDVLEEYLNISGVPIRIIDTAGIRYSHDLVEQEGVRRTISAIESADIVLIVLDGSQPLTAEDRKVLDVVGNRNAIALINKSDLPRRMNTLMKPEIQIAISCRCGDGLETLKSAITEQVNRGSVNAREHAWAVNQRHKTALENAKHSLRNAQESIASGLSPEFMAVDLRGALDCLGEIIGATYTEDILNRIFDDFCIGK